MDWAPLVPQLARVRLVPGGAELDLGAMARQGHQVVDANMGHCLPLRATWADRGFTTWHDALPEPVQHERT